MAKWKPVKGAPKMGTWNAKKELFCSEYLIDLNGTQAALRAGYAKKGAAQQASRLLRDVKVQAKIQELMKARAEQVEVTAEMVLAELKKIGFSNMAHYINVDKNGDAFVDLSGIDADRAAAITEVIVEDLSEDMQVRTGRLTKTRIKLADKRAALVDMGKHLGMWNQPIKIEPGDILTELLSQIDGQTRGLPRDQD